MVNGKLWMQLLNLTDVYNKADGEQLQSFWFQSEQRNTNSPKMGDSQTDLLQTPVMNL